MNGTTASEVDLFTYAEIGKDLDGIRSGGGPKLIGARGVAVNASGSIAVADILTNQVNVYRESSGKFRHHFEFLSSKGTLDKHLRHPMDIAIDSSGKHLLVNNSPYVRLYSQTGQFEGRFSTLMHSEFRDTQVNLQCITTASDGRVILVGDNQRKLLTIHDSNYAYFGTINVEIQPAYISSDRQRGHIAVSDDFSGKVCVLDIETGQEIFRFRTSCARGVAYHEPSGSLFVASGSHSSKELGQPGSVEQYCCKSGGLVGRPLQNLLRPYGLCVTCSEKLVVSDRDTVKIFDVKYP